MKMISGLCLAGILALTAPATAQSQQSRTAGATTTSQGHFEPTIDLDFEGGTALEYIEAIQKAAGIRSVVAMPGVERVEMPPVKLTGVSMEGALGVLDFSESGPAIHIFASELRSAETSSSFERNREISAGHIPDRQPSGHLRRFSRAMISSRRMF